MTKEALSAPRTAMDPRRGSRPAGRTTTLDPCPTPPRQLPLGPAVRTQQARQLRDRLRAYLRGTLRIIVTDNRSVMISVQRDVRHRQYTVRLHHLFADAPAPVLTVLARYILHGDRQASQELNAYIEERQDRIRRPRTRQIRSTPLRTRGRVHDLQPLFDGLNSRYFGDQVQCRITWGKHVGQGRPRRSVKVGSYFVELDLIRIHPGLDREWIPRFYIEWVIFHEMLHALHPIPVVNGRRRFHTSAFEEDERQFEHYRLATDWEKSNVAALLRI